MNEQPMTCPHCGHAFTDEPVDGSAECPACHTPFNLEPQDSAAIGMIFNRGPMVPPAEDNALVIEAPWVGLAEVHSLNRELMKWHGQGSKVTLHESGSATTLRIQGDGPQREAAAAFVAGWLACCFPSIEYSDDAQRIEVGRLARQPGGGIAYGLRDGYRYAYYSEATRDWTLTTCDRAGQKTGEQEQCTGKENAMRWLKTGSTVPFKL